MADDHQTFRLEPVDFHIVMHNVAQAVEDGTFLQFTFGNVNGVNNAKTKPGMGIDGNRHEGVGLGAAKLLLFGESAEVDHHGHIIGVDPPCLVSSPRIAEIEHLDPESDAIAQAGQAHFR